MSQRELEAVVMVLSAVVISAWVGWDAAGGGVPATLSAAAWKMVWAVGYSIGFNILAVIVGHIVFAIVTNGGKVDDERADERDRMIAARSMRNAYFVLSIGVAGVLIWQALGLPAELGPYALFGISQLAGGAFALSQIIYYRVG
ncbi:MAG TPA: hypothetical protein VFE52_11880 [Devosia sp.]|jgi:hypothetical protein|nr:hypothetical protein [Devosia sp.]